MWLPIKSDQTSSAAATGMRSILGMGAVMLLACLAGPVLAGAAGALGAGVLVGAGGAVSAVALCLIAPAAMVAWRRRSNFPMSVTRQRTDRPKGLRPLPRTVDGPENEKTPRVAGSSAQRAREDSNL
ncbi:hypothetical protein [Solirubrobacter deserti]|uniref:Membrane transport protein MMPL domain-containing protein n=1 Tax=Solirubrobacter deserti TaxID=2282478 RepID=A0ABT4REX1_9ACTN|nr:hypothetical protein [Solirubrobacter deserti]MDA0137062.1 hypothetical protein [Solirubrobacter deserti]